MTGCWNWTGATFEGGYGAITINGNARRVPRAAYMVFVGPIASDLCVCHRCDNPSCFNPEHLFLGTLADNVRDMDAKGRRGRYERKRGGDHPQARLTDEQVYEVRLLVGEGWKQGRVAEMYGVRRQWVNEAVNGKRRVAA